MEQKENPSVFPPELKPIYFKKPTNPTPTTPTPQRKTEDQTYCFKCKTYTPDSNPSYVVIKGRNQFNKTSKCPKCGTTKKRIVRGQS